MNNFTPRHAALAAVLALLLTACAPPPPPAPTLGQVPTTAGEAHSQPLQSAHILDLSIRKKIAVQSVHARRTANLDAEIIARLVNLTDYPQQIEARAYFTDSQGIQTEPTSAWQRLHLAPRSTASYHISSTTGTAVAGYQLEFRGGQ